MGTRSVHHWDQLYRICNSALIRRLYRSQILARPCSWGMQAGAGRPAGKHGFTSGLRTLTAHSLSATNSAGRLRSDDDDSLPALAKQVGAQSYMLLLC